MSWLDKLVDKARGYEEIKAVPHAFVGDRVNTNIGPGEVTEITGDESKPFGGQRFKVQLDGTESPIWIQRGDLNSDRYLDGNGNIVYY